MLSLMREVNQDKSSFCYVSFLINDLRKVITYKGYVWSFDQISQQKMVFLRQTEQLLHTQAFCKIRPRRVHYTLADPDFF